MGLNLGILIPQSNTYPAIGRDFMDGLELSTKGCSIHLHIEGIGFGADMEQIINSVQKLQNQYRVHLVTGLIGHHQIERLYQLMNDLESLLFYSDLGAKLPYGLKKSPWIFCNSFDLFHSAIETGKRMVANGHKNIVNSTCYYDAGYGFTQALEKGLYDSGGSFAGHFITPLNPREQEAALMKQYMDIVNPHAIYAQYSGIFAREHASFLQQNKLSLGFPVYASHFAIENELLTDFPEIFQNTKCVTSWMPEEDNEASRKFVSAYSDEYGRQPSVFSLLGYENGKAIATATNSLSKFSSSEIKRNLETVDFESPRGRFQFHPDTHRTFFDQCLWNIRFENGKYIKRKQGQFVNDTSLTLELMSGEIQVPGGWYNTYLCQ